MTDPPLLSILIPAWNRVDEVARAVESVGDHPEGVEVVVVDNASAPAVFERLKDRLAGHPQVRLYRNDSNIGMVRNWNRCISYATGTWLGLLCSDDEYEPGAVERAILLMEKTAEPSLIIQSPGIETDVLTLPAGVETVKGLMLPIASGNFWHRELSERVGGFDDRFEYSADAEFWYRLALSFPVVKVREPFARYNIHGDNYMWATWEREDFLGQTELLARTVRAYTHEDGGNLEELVRGDLWSTLTTILTNTALKPGKERLFARYAAIAAGHADSPARMKEFAGLMLNLGRARVKQGLKRLAGRG